MHLPDPKNLTASADHPAPTSAVSRLIHRWGLLIGLAVMAAVGVFGLGRRSFWMDEGYTWTIIAQPSWSKFIEALDLTASNMSGYMTLLRVWSAGGDSETWLRIPSLAFALGTVFVVHRAARAALGSRIAGIAALLAGTSVPLTFYGLEARSYSMLAFFSALSWWALIRALHDDRRWQWVLVGLATLGAISAQVIALLALPSLGLAVLLHHRLDRAIVRMLPTGVAGIAGLAGIAVSSERDTGGFPPPLSPSVIARAIRFLAGDHGTLTRDGVGFVIMLGFGVLFVISAVELLRRRPAHTDPRWTVWLWFVGPPITITVVSIVSPLLWHRMVIGSLPAAFIIAAMAIDSLPVRRLAPIAVVALACLGTARSIIIADDDLGEYDRLSEELLLRSAPGDTLIFAQPWERSALDYYLRDDRDRFDASPEIGPVLIYGELSTHEDFLASIEPGSTVWVVDAIDAAAVWRGETIIDADFDFEEAKVALSKRAESIDAGTTSAGASVIEADSFDVGRFRVVKFEMPST